MYGYDYAAATEQAMGQYPLLSRYGPVTDVFPYAADGTPLEDVLLYDQDGRPLEVGFQEWWADGCPRVLEQPLAADGVPVLNVFPQSYELDPYAAPMTAGSCSRDVPRPEVPLPVLPGADGTSPAPASPSGAAPSSGEASPSGAGPSSAPVTSSGAPAPGSSVTPAPGD